jgi:hypothetical protein
MDELINAFRDSHAGKRRADWPARWRTWVRERVDRAAPRGRGSAVGRDAGWHDPTPLARGGMVHDNGERFQDYRERMIREGKLRAAERAPDTGVH